MIKTKRLVLIAIFISCISSAYAMGSTDWSHPIINGYELWRVNSENIHLVRVFNDDDKKSSTAKTVLNDDFVIAFWNNEQYILIHAISEEDSFI